MKYTKLIAASAIALASALPALAQGLSFANFTPPFHTVNASVIEKMNSLLSEATGGAVTVRGFMAANWARPRCRCRSTRSITPCKPG